MRLFLYGTLMDPEIFALVVRQEISNAMREPAILAGYRRGRVKGETYPSLVAAPQKSVTGVAVSDLSDESIDRIRFFEGREYVIERVAVRLTATARDVSALAFVATPDTAVAVNDWEFSAWCASPAKARDVRLTRAWMKLYGEHAYDDPALDAQWSRLCAADAREHGASEPFG